MTVMVTLQRFLIYVFPEKELCGLGPNFHSHVSVSILPAYFLAAE
jgi:hypothetical protein